MILHRLCWEYNRGYYKQFKFTQKHYTLDNGKLNLINSICSLQKYQELVETIIEGDIKYRLLGG